MEKTISQKALELIETVPHDQFITDLFTNKKDKCCFFGHLNRLTSDDPSDYSDSNCMYGSRPRSEDNLELKLRIASNEFLIKKGLLDKGDRHGGIPSVNNSPEINGYNEPEIKDRVVHLLKDMIAAGY